MPIEPTPLKPLQGSPYTPPGPEPIVWEEWQGLNTLTDRAGVPDKQAYWIDGFLPIAQRNLRTLPGIGASIYSVSAGSITFFDFYNIGTVAYGAVFTSDGRVDQVNLTSNATMAILGAGSITSPSILNQGITQWGRQYLIIVSNQTNGYWVWDGAKLYTAGNLSPVVSILNVGGGYISAPTVVVQGGHGTGASVTVSINSAGQIIGGTVVNPGSGFLATDAVSATLVPTPTGGGGGSITASMATISGGTWSLSSLSIVAAGSLYANPTLVFTSSGIASPMPAAFALVTSGSITGTSITNRGAILSGGAPTVTVTIVDAGTAGSVGIYLMPFGIQATCAETYQGHVWAINSTLLQWTAPGSFSDFSTSNGGGNSTLVASYIRNGYVRMISANGFLYLIGDSCVDYISGVTTSGVPPTTTFSLLNADPQVGSPYPASVQLFGRNPMFANSMGVWVCYGADVKKVSDMLDGVWSSVSNFGGIQLASAEATIFTRKVWMELVRIVDPVSGTTANKVAMWDGKQWFTSTQDIPLNYVKGQEINSVFTAYGTNGTVIYPLFATASSGFTKTVQSRLWDTPGGYEYDKTADRWWGMYRVNSTVAASLGVTFDSVFNNPNGPSVDGSGAAYTIAAPVNVGLFVAGPEAVGIYGELIGMTLKTTAADIAIVSAKMSNQAPIYRG